VWFIPLMHCNNICLHEQVKIIEDFILEQPIFDPRLEPRTSLIEATVLHCLTHSSPTPSLLCMCSCASHCGGHEAYYPQGRGAEYSGSKSLRNVDKLIISARPHDVASQKTVLYQVWGAPLSKKQCKQIASNSSYDVIKNCIRICVVLVSFFLLILEIIPLSLWGALLPLCETVT
jgi:hypothetical protein